MIAAPPPGVTPTPATGPARARRTAQGVPPPPATGSPPHRRRIFVLDTSVLLSDPAAFHRFAEHEVVLPLVVISELEGKRHHPELGWFARQSLRLLDELRIKHGRLDQPVPVNDDGGTLRVELNHADPAVLPQGFRNDTNDARILSVALGLAAEGCDVTLVTKDMPLRVKAASVGLSADEYRHGQASDPTWTGMAELELAEEQVSRLYAGEALDLTSLPKAATRSLPCHTGLVLHSRARLGAGPGAARTRRCGWCAATGRRSGCAAARPSSGSRWTCCSTSRSASSRWAGGPAPASRRWRCAPGLEAVMERRRHKKVIVFRPLYAVGGQELGYLPGSESEKMSPWAQAVFDTLGAVVHENVMEEVMARGMLEVLPLTHIRGRSLHDAFVIVDEAQSLERGVLLTVLSRIGTGLAGRAHPRRGPAGQPAGRPARRRDGGDRGAQGSLRSSLT